VSKHNSFDDLEALRQGAEMVDAIIAKTVPRTKRNQRLVAFPWAFLVAVRRLTAGRTALLVAMYIYRRTHVCGSSTVTLPGTELAELGVDRKSKSRALGQLETAGLIQVRASAGRTAKVTLLWQPE
jgi:hypothetical protein